MVSPTPSPTGGPEKGPLSLFKTLSALIVLSAVVISAFLIIRYQPRQPVSNPQTPPPASQPAQGVQEPPAQTPQPSDNALAPPSPNEQDLAQVEQQIADTFEQAPLLDRLQLWWSCPSPQMPEDDYEKARALYVKFLSNFLKIETATFRVEWHETKGRAEQLTQTDDVTWSPPKFRLERRDAKGKKTLSIFDGEQVCRYEEGDLKYKGKSRARGVPAIYWFGMELATIHDNHPFYLNYFTNCDIDDGSKGYSRLWNPNGAEQRFDTATSLLTSSSFAPGQLATYTYQNINGIWFLSEHVDQYAKERTTRLTFTQVTLNHPVDPSLFDIKNKN